MKILVTGSSGFIGFHLIKLLLKKHHVMGVDSHNNYYSIDLKKNRLKVLKQNNRFIFKKVNLTHKKKLDKIFFYFKPDLVIHLAGQPGVLYSLKNPKSYFINNILATKTLCEICLKYHIQKFIFGSSSSVYGNQKKYPIKENSKTNPKNPYAKTKLQSEKIIEQKFKNKINYVIFRFFTVYGPLGRPDMFIHKFLHSVRNKMKIQLYNAGYNYRDFTYVEDVAGIIFKSLKKNFKYKIYNICRSKPLITNNVIKLIEKYYKKSSVELENIPFVKGEMLKTHGSNLRLKKEFRNLKFTDIKIGLRKTISYFKKFKH